MGLPLQEPPDGLGVPVRDSPIAAIWLGVAVAPHSLVQRGVLDAEQGQHVRNPKPSGLVQWNLGCDGLGVAVGFPLFRSRAGCPNYCHRHTPPASSARLA